jgi:hypothetical protein
VLSGTFSRHFRGEKLVVRGITRLCTCNDISGRGQYLSRHLRHYPVQFNLGYLNLGHILMGVFNVSKKS